MKPDDAAIRKHHDHLLALFRHANGAGHHDEARRVQVALGALGWVLGQNPGYETVVENVAATVARAAVGG